jgi:hypothetical protein
MNEYHKITALICISITKLQILHNLNMWFCDTFRPAIQQAQYRYQVQAPVTAIHSFA